MSPVQHPVRYVVLAAMAASVSLATWCHLTGGLDQRAMNSLDSAEYLTLGRTLSEHGLFSRSADPPLIPETWRTPGYPVILAMWFKVAGSSATAVIVLHLMLGVLNTALLALWVKTVAGPRCALVAGLLFSAELYHHTYALWVLSTTAFTTALLLACLTAQHCATRPAAWKFLGLGVLLGSIVLIRPAGILVPVAVCGALLLSSRRRLVSGALLCLAAAAVLPGMWMWRNHALSGHANLSTQGGIVLSYFKAAEVELWRDGATAERYVQTAVSQELDDEHTVWNSIDEELQQALSARPEDGVRWTNLAQGNRTKFDSFVVDAKLKDIGIRRLLSDPLSTLSCCLWRSVVVLSFPITLAVTDYDELNEGPIQRNIALGVFFVSLAVAAICGAWCGRSRRFPVMLAIGIVVALMATTVPQVDPRFRVPMIPMLILLAVMLLAPGAKESPCSPEDEQGLDVQESNGS